MMRAPWLGAVLADAGLTVHQTGGWKGRGRDMTAIYGVVVHDTVTTSDWPDRRVVELLRDGRTAVPGPLAQLGVRRDGSVDIVADGRANHNGYGTWGNNSIGIEVYAAGGLEGREERWNDRQYETVTRAARAILDRLDLGRSSHWNPRVAGHKETDPARKIDPWGIDCDRLRRDVAEGDIMATLDDDDLTAIARNVWGYKGWNDDHPQDAWSIIRTILRERVDADDLAKALADRLDIDVAGASAEEIVAELARRLS